MECQKINLLTTRNIKSDSNIRFAKFSSKQNSYQNTNTTGLNLSPNFIYAKSLINFNGISKAKLGEYIEILRNNGIEVKQDLQDKMLILSEYHQPKGKKFSQLGLDENALFKHVKHISGDAIFTGSELTSLNMLESIGGNADFRGTKIYPPNITGLEEDNQTYTSNLLNKILSNKPKIKQNPLKCLGKLSYIGGCAYFENSRIQSLKHLKAIGKSADFQHSNIEDLGALTTIGGDADFRYSKIKNLKRLEVIKDHADFRHSQIASTGKLKIIGGHAFFEDSKISSLGNIEKIGGNAYFPSSLPESWGNLEIIEGNAVFGKNC